MRKIILDCDTGGDDAAAIALAAASKELELLGVTAVMGNMPLAQTYRNGREVIGFLGVDVPVLKGADRPLIRDYWVGNEEGHTLDFPGNEHVMCPEHELGALDWLVKTLKESDGPVTLLPLAPLTNIAKLMLFYPDLVEEKVDEIVLMGGGFMFGNSTGAAELNIYGDPEAAQVVFSFGKPVVMCGLDVCHKAYITEEESKVYETIDTRAGKLFAGIAGHVFNMDESFFADKPELLERINRWERPGAIVYDTVPIIYLLHPEVFTAVPANISVECSSDLCYGLTVCDTRNWGPENEPKRHKVVLDVDREGYLKAVEEVLRNSAV
ncbi:MAG: nucleoside hydrolase [Oscillospiraceae bacterium]|nr:nucleoside hydrolase [Oscillospiraceae bacterium]